MAWYKTAAATTAQTTIPIPDTALHAKLKPKLDRMPFGKDAKGRIVDGGTDH